MNDSLITGPANPDSLKDDRNGWRVEALRRAGHPQRGFAGPGHIATEVFKSEAFDATDPFVLLMDDVIDFAPGQPVGQAHPHAGMATATLILEGSLLDQDEGALQAGDLAWMIAGSGVIHNESLRSGGLSRILQLWIGLPQTLRHQPPSVWRLSPDYLQAGDVFNTSRTYTAPISAGGYTAGDLGILTVDLTPGLSLGKTYPTRHTLLMYVLQGSVELQNRRLKSRDVALLRSSSALPNETLNLTAGSEGLYAVVFSAPPVGEPLFHHGPFVASSQKELASYYESFAKGKFKRIRDLYRRPPDAPGPHV